MRLKNWQTLPITIANGEITITSAKVSPKQSNEQLTQKLDKLKSKTTYTLSFESKAKNVQKPLVVTLGRSKNWQKGHYGLFRKIILTSEWKDHKLTFTTKQIEEGNSSQLKLLFGEMQGELSLRKVILVKVTEVIKVEIK